MTVREKVVDGLEWITAYAFTPEEAEDIGDAIDLLKEQRPAQHGYWEIAQMGAYMAVRCSVCGNRQMGEGTNYCPNCGAEMGNTE